MDNAQFEQSKAGLIARLTERDKNLGQRSARYWADLQLGITQFDSAQQIAQHAAEIGKPEIVAFLRSAVDKLDSQSLVIFNRGKFAALPEQGKTISDIAKFKRG